jgi:hypothetical protein
MKLPITTKVDLCPNPHAKYPNIQVWGCYADGYSKGLIECTSFQIPGSSFDAIEAAKWEFYELYGSCPSYIRVQPITDITIIH